jgi:AcrR family transcriptional regulator
MAVDRSSPVKNPTSLREAHRDLTRSRIRNAARDLFYEHHSDSTTMDEIALAAGLRRQTLYLHYKDKSEILTDIIADWVPRARAFMATLPGPRPALKQLHKWIEEVTKFVAKERAPLSIVLEVRRTSPAHMATLEMLTGELLAGLGENNPPFRDAAEGNCAPIMRARAILLLRALTYSCDLYLDDPTKEYARALLQVTAEDFQSFLAQDTAPLPNRRARTSEKASPTV